MIVVSANGNRIQIGIVEYFAIVVNSLAAAVFFDRFIGAFGYNIAEVFDFGMLRAHVGGNVCAVSYVSATDYGNFYFVFHSLVLLCVILLTKDKFILNFSGHI